MRRLSAVLALLLLSCCSILDTKTERGVSEDQGWSGNSAFTTADVRIITQRRHPIIGNTIVCVEPSPDVADAVSSSAGLTAKGGTTTVSGGLTISGASAEAEAELAGRSTALLGLRDGLFEACEAYANGAIGQDDYALITSVYGQLMTTLFLAQDVTSASAVAGATATSPLIQAPGGSDSDNGGAGTTPKKSTVTTDSSYEATSSGQAGVILAEDESGLPIQPVSMVAKVPKSKGSAMPGDTGSTTADKQVAAGVGGNASAVMPLALVRMNEDYSHRGLLGVLLVACVNEYDPSRYPYGHNAWLEDVCTQLADTNTLMKLEKADAAVDATEGFKAVDPTSAAIASPSAGARATAPVKKTSTTVKKTPNLIIKVVHVLTVASANHGLSERRFSPPLKKLRDSATPALLL